MLGREGEFPGVAAPSEREIWLSLCPDANLIVGVPADRLGSKPAAPAALLAERRRRLGPNLSLSYSRPIVMARGYRQYLYDVDGRRFLDGVNNVPHVGHNHPRVVEAAARQLAVLNTNTRYLHESIVDLRAPAVRADAARLSVVYLVCSGSEANELALRLARAYTGHTRLRRARRRVPRQHLVARRDQPLQVQRAGRSRAGAARARGHDAGRLPRAVSRGRSVGWSAIRPGGGAGNRTGGGRPAGTSPRSSANRCSAAAARSSCRTATSSARTRRRVRRAPWRSPTRCRSDSAASARMSGASRRRASRPTSSRSASRSATGSRSAPSSRGRRSPPRSTTAWSTSTRSAERRRRARWAWPCST